MLGFIETYGYRVGDYISTSCGAWYQYWGYKETKRAREALVRAQEQGILKRVRVVNCVDCGHQMMEEGMNELAGMYYCPICGKEYANDLFDKSSRSIYKVLRTSR